MAAVPPVPELAGSLGLAPGGAVLPRIDVADGFCIHRVHKEALLQRAEGVGS